MQQYPLITQANFKLVVQHLKRRINTANTDYLDINAIIEHEKQFEKLKHIFGRKTIQENGTNDFIYTAPIINTQTEEAIQICLFFQDDNKICWLSIADYEDCATPQQLTVLRLVIQKLTRYLIPFVVDENITNFIL